MSSQYVYAKIGVEREISLDDAEYHHISRVLRIKDGTTVTAFDGNGKTCKGELRSGKLINIDAVVEHNKSNKIILMQSLTNEPSTIDDIVRKATELGISEFIPVIADRTEKVRWPAEKHMTKLSRWNQIAIDACKQSKNPFLPKIHNISQIAKSICSTCINLYCSLENYSISVAKVDCIDKDVCIIIGPEGGFSKNEETILKNICTPIKLANTVLRSDTAAIAALSQLTMQCAHH